MIYHDTPAYSHLIDTISQNIHCIGLTMEDLFRITRSGTRNNSFSYRTIKHKQKVWKRSLISNYVSLFINYIDMYGTPFIFK